MYKSTSNPILSMWLITIFRKRNFFYGRYHSANSTFDSVKKRYLLNDEGKTEGRSGAMRSKACL
jgi:hypothetical protein